MAKLKPSRVLPVNRPDRFRSTSLNAAVTEGCCRIAGSDRSVAGGSGMQEESTAGTAVLSMSAAESENRHRTPIFEQGEEKGTEDEETK